MSKKILSLLLVAASALGANAQLLWKVSGNGAKGESYLLGTHHLAPISILDSIKGFNAAIEVVDAVGGEIDMADQAAQAPLMMQYMMAPADSTLSKLLTPEQADSVMKVMAKYMGPGASIDAIGPLKPAAISTQMALMETLATMPPEVARAVMSGQQLDGQVQAMGRAASKEMIAMETIEEQLQLLFGAPLTEQAEDLMEGVKQILEGKAVESARKLTDAYMSQNLAAIEQQVFNCPDSKPEDLKKMITDRNGNWVVKLAEIMPEKTILLAVGCGHLPGPEGLIEQLRNAGYTVEPYGN